MEIKILRKKYSKEYNEKNKEKIRLQKQEYWQRNKEKKLRKIKCEICNNEVCKPYYKYHILSDKHLKNVKKLSQLD